MEFLNYVTKTPNDVSGWPPLVFVVSTTSATYVTTAVVDLFGLMS